MIQPIVGIRVKDRRFISLLNSEGNEEKSVILYRSDFEENSVPLYICKLQSETKIEKIYKIGYLSVDEDCLQSAAESEEQVTERNHVIKIASSVKNNQLLIYLYYGKEKNFYPIKMYELNIYEEIESQDIQERDTALLDYGDFVKCSSKGADLIPEEDLTSKGLLKEKSSQKKNKRKKEKINSKDFYKLSDQAEESKSSIAGKMLVYSTFVLFLAVIGIIYIFNWNYRNTLINQQKEFVKSVNEQVSYSVEKMVCDIEKSAKLILNADSDKAVNELIKTEKKLIAVINDYRQIYNYDFMNISGLTENKILMAVNSDANSIKRAKYNKTCIKNTSQLLGTKSAALYMPSDSKKSCVIAVFKIDDFEDICLTENNISSFVVDKDGFIIAGLDPVLTMKNQRLYNNKVVNQYLVDPESKEVFDVSEEEIVYGNFDFNDNGEFAVVTSSIMSVTKDMSLVIARESLSAVCAIIVFAMLFIWFYGTRLAQAIKSVTAATYRIGQGIFDISLKSCRRDEIGVLAKAVEKMGKNLSIRDNAKQALGRFADDELEERATNGELKLDGENRFSTVMFCGIRNFKNISRRFRAEEILSFLNEYYSEVEKCITQNGGYVDKLTGDRLLAVFGSPVSSGTPKQDALNCMTAAEKLREVISNLNEKLVNEGKTGITIGLGIDSGSIVAGQLGSKNTRSYTCLGKAISLASEAEKLTKKYECRVIITENTFKMVKDFVDSESIGPYVDGEDKVELYSVTGLKENVR